MARVANSPCYGKQDFRTLKNWVKEGRLPKDMNAGEVMWCNQFCQNSATYWPREETIEATSEQLAEVKAMIREEELKVRRKRYAADNRRRREARGEKRMWKYIEAAKQVPPVPSSNPSGIVVFDLETTGLDYGDEILQFSAIDGEGKTLLNTYVKPYAHESWPEAQRINHIRPEMVEDAPRLHEILPTIQGIFNAATQLVSYNGSFDAGMLERFGVDLGDTPHFDVMEEFAPIYGEWSEYYGNYKWQKLTQCAKYYGYEFKAHDSLEDCIATLFCYRKIIESKQK